MPNDNLGTASGTIRLNLEDRASSKLLLTLTKMSRQFDDMNKRLIKIDKSLNGTDRSFDKAAKSIDRSTKATKGFGGGLIAANKSVTKMSRDVNELYTNFNKLSSALDKANRWYVPLNRTYKVFDQMAKLRLDGTTNSLLRFGKAVKQVGLLNNLYSKSWRGFFGVDSAMREMPTWTQNLNRFAIKMAQVGTAGVLIGKLAKANPFEKFLNTKAFAKIAMQSEGAGLAIQNFVKKADHNFNFLSRSFNKHFAPISSLANNLKGFLTGAALIRSGIDGIANKFAWLGRIPRPILMSLGVLISTVLPAALEVFGKALSGASNLLVGLLNGVKQLSGGFLVLPGLLASIGAVVSSLIPVFAGLKDKFKDVFSEDPKKAFAAYAKLPQHLRPLADVIRTIIPRWKQLTATLQSTAFYNAEKQIQSLAQNYMPLFEKGASKVVVAVRGIKDEFVAFLEQQQTMGDVSSIYDMVAEALGNIKNAIRPALNGFKDIAVVGTAFLRDMTALLPGLVQQFAQWASVNRQNGNLLRWMQESRKGIYDLIHGFVDLTKAVWTILTLFKTNTGGNFLESFSDAMERFNNAVQRSAGSGVLRDIGNAVRGLGTDKLKIFMDVFKNADGFMQSSFVDMMKAVWPVIQTVAEGFSTIFIPALKQAMFEIKNFAEVLHALGIDSVIGTILGLVAAFKILPTVLVPVYHGLKTIVGTFLLLRNAGKMTEYVTKGIDALVAGFDKFGGVGAKASASITRVKGSLGGLISGLAAVAGPLAAIMVAVGVGWLAWEQRNKTIKDGMDQIADSAQHVKDAGKEIANAFLDDGGLAGNTVMDAVSQSLDTMLQDLDSTAGKAPGIMDHIGDFLQRGGAAGGIIGPIQAMVSGESDALNKLQQVTADAQRAQDNFRTAGVTQDELKVAVTGSADAYEALRQRLLAAGDGYDQSIAQVNALRQQFQQAQADAEKLGTAGVQLAVGIDKIATAAGDTTTKLEGLKSVLTALGFLKTDALQAAVEYADAIQNLSSNVAEAIASGGGLEGVWDGVNRKFNENTETGRNLIGVFSELSTTFLTSASAGQGIDQMMADLNAQLPGIAEQLGISQDELRHFMTYYEGIAPEPIRIAVQLEGVTDELTKTMGTILVSLQSLASGGIEVPIKLENATEESATELENQIEKTLGQDVLNRTGAVLELKPGVKLDEHAMQALVNFLNQHGVDTTTKKADPSKVPSITPNIKPPESSKVKAATGSVEEALAKLEVDAKSAADAIQGSGEQFAEFLEMLADEKNAPVALLDTLKQMRDQFENGGSQVKAMSDAIRDFSDATLDADSRAKNFIESLENVGKLPNDDYLAKYQEDVDSAIGYQANLVDMLDKTGDALVLQGGRLDQNSKNGRTLSSTMRQLIQDSAALVAAGDATPEEAYANTTGVLKELLTQFQISPTAQQEIINTYFPPDAFNKGLKDAMSEADPRKAIEDIFAQDPAKLNSVINLLDSNDDILNKIVGPDGKLHIPSVFDPNIPGQQPPGMGYPGMPPGLPTQPLTPPVAPPTPPPLPTPQPLPPPTSRPTTAPDPTVLTDEAKILEILGEHPELKDVLQPYIDQAGEQGITFSEAFAKGIEDGSPAVVEAIKRLAGLAGHGLGSSPAKYGPLSGRGWTLYRGKTFTKAWAQGISSEGGSVKGAVSGIAGEAATATGSYEGTDLGDYLKQLKDLSGFAQHFVEVVKNIADLAIGVATIANTFSGGRLFPKQYTRDNSVDRRRGNALPAFNPTGAPASNTRAANGQPRSGVPAATAPADAKGDEVAQAFISQAKAHGWNDEQILAGLGVLNQETGYGTNPATNNVQNQNGTAGITGVFQQDMDYRKYGDPRDVNNAITGFITEFENRGGMGQDPWDFAVSGVQKPANVGEGGYWDRSGAGAGSYLKNKQRQQALEVLNRLGGGAPTTPAPATPAPAPNTPTPAPAPKPAAPTKPFVAKPVTGQFHDIGNGFYTYKGKTFRKIGGKYYDVVDVATDAKGQPRLNENGIPIANEYPTASTPAPAPSAPTPAPAPTPTTPAPTPAPTTPAPKPAAAPAAGGLSETPYPSPLFNERTADPTRFLVHTSEDAPPEPKALADWMKAQGDRSYNYIIDRSTGAILDVVDAANAAFSVGSPGNASSINAVIAGSQASWTREEWMANAGPGIAALGQLIARDSARFGIPLQRLANDVNATGFGGHDWVTQVLGGTTHTDPGAQFPWDQLEQAIIGNVPGGITSTTPTTPTTQQPVTDLAAFDRALLANVPVGTGRYDSDVKDLQKGLADCSSSVEDLVNMMDGLPTGGGTLTTHNASTELAKRGFVPGGLEGAFNVGWNEGHMEATLPGGTNFNWGNTNPSAVSGGIKGAVGAFDPQFTNIMHRPVTAMPGTPTNPLSVTNPNFPSISEIPEGLDALGQRPGTEDEAVKVLQGLDSQIADITAQPESPLKDKQLDALGQKRTAVMEQFGLKEQPNAIDQASGIISSVAGVAGSIFQAINSGIEAIVATKDITQTLVRYPSNTEDIYRLIDDFQKYIQFAADVAGATSAVLGMVGDLASAGAGFDMGASGAIKGASQIAAMVQAALETVNAVIDLGQEAYRIIGTYVGDLLGYLVGGADSLRGNIKFLLDTQTNELMAYTQDNPLDKRVHEGVGGKQGDRGQLARDIYVYGGPGQDPRDNTRQMLLQVKMSQQTVPTGQ